MPLISSHNANDERVRCRMMASSALRSLEDHSHRLENFDELQNAYRMLKSYRLRIFGRAVVDDYNEEDDSSSNVEYLLQAFDRAKNAAFHNDPIDSEKAASRLQDALQRFVNLKEIGPQDQQSVELTKEFFKALIRELS
jgi:hypothetical protein